MKVWLQRNLQGDPVIWGIIFILSFLSILVVYSATGSLAYKMTGGDTEAYLRKHSFLVFLSLTAMWVAHKLDYRYYSGLSKLGLFLSLPLLVLVFVSGDSINGANRWFNIFGLSFQPSDLAKLSLIAFVSSKLSKMQENIEEEIRSKSFLVMLGWIVVICVLIALSNISTALLLFVTCFLLLFIGRVPMKFLGLLVLAGGIGAPVALKLGNRLDTAISRIKKFFDPEIIPDQALLGYKSIASGGLFGRGFGNSIQSDFLPHSYSDFIYAHIIEEIGFIGGIVVLFLYLALLYRGMKTVMGSEMAFGGLLSAGLAFSLVIQAMINMGVAVGLGPITGQPLPLLSMGGTSLLFTGISLGVILSVSRGNISNAFSGESQDNLDKNAAKK